MDQPFHLPLPRHGLLNLEILESYPVVSGFILWLQFTRKDLKLAHILEGFTTCSLENSTHDFLKVRIRNIFFLAHKGEPKKKVGETTWVSKKHGIPQCPFVGLKNPN